MRTLLRATGVVGFFVLLPWLGYGAEPSVHSGTVVKEGIFVLEEELKKEEKQVHELKEIVNKSTGGTRPVPVPVVAQARQEVEWATAKVKQAQEALQRAKVAPNTAAAQVYLKEALLKADEARNWSRRAVAAVDPRPAAAPEPAGLRQGAGQKFESHAFRQLVKAAELGQTDFGGPAVGERRGADPIRYDSQKQLLTTPSGQTINVAPLAEALRRTVKDPRAPVKLFEPVQAPGLAPGYRLNKEALKAVSSPQSREELKKVGGVALEVTLDLLSFAGVPEFRKSGSATVIESPVLISLSALYERVFPQADSLQRWEGLADELRYPGSVERIHGFVLDPTNRDVFLVGSRATVVENRIDIDALILGLRSVWASGIIPAVSLDPLVDRPMGPQRARVTATDPNALLAKLMLDADYAMKRIMLGDLDVGEPGFRMINKLLVQQKRPGSHFVRFWLNPTPLGGNSIHVSATYRTFLFETGVRTLTETMRAVADGLAGTGEVDELSRRAADLFTALYDKLEYSPQVVPYGIFRRLHGLIDIVTVSKLLREMGVDYPILEKLSQLPFRRLKGAEAVPAHYPAVNVTVFQQGNITRFVWGGVVLKLRATRQSLDQYQDAVTATLEKATDTFQPQRMFYKTLSLTFSIPRPKVEGERTVEQMMLAGQAALEARRYKVAVRQFRQITEADPFYAEAWAYLGQAESLLGHYQDARRGVAKALELEPKENLFRIMALDIDLRSNPNLDLSSWEEPLRRELSVDYSLQAGFARDRGEISEARRLAEVAIRLWNENPEAYLARSLSWEDQVSQAAGQDRFQAISLYRKPIRGGEESGRPRRLAFALGWNASKRLEGLGRRLEDIVTNPDVRRAAAREFEQSASEIEEARRLDESSPLPLLADVHYETLMQGLLPSFGRPQNLRRARLLAEEVIRRFPDFAEGYTALAKLKMITVGPPALIAQLKYEAMQLLNKAISLDPTFSDPVLWRASLHAKNRSCSEATRDLERARALGANVTAEVERVIRGLCP